MAGRRVERSGAVLKIDGYKIPMGAIAARANSLRPPPQVTLPPAPAPRRDRHLDPSRSPSASSSITLRNPTCSWTRARKEGHGGYASFMRIYTGAP